MTTEKVVHAGSGHSAISYGGFHTGPQQANWMSANWMWKFHPYFGSAALECICLPGTHDSATAHLKACWTDERNENFGMSFIHLLEDNLGISSSPVWKALLGEARATNLDIRTQLLAGVRAFDFRVWPVKRPSGPVSPVQQIEEFYSVHRFLGENYTIIVNQLIDFLKNYKGEVVYARFRFYDENKLVTGEECKTFLAWLTEQLRPYLVTRKECSNPFKKEYGALVDGGSRSRIIIHFYDEEFRHTDFKNFSERDLFFTTEEIGLHGDSVKNGDTVDQMIKQQRQYVVESQTQSRSSALWLVAVPPPARYEQVGKEAYEEEFDPLHWFHSRNYTDQLLRDFVRPFNAAIEDMIHKIFFSGEHVIEKPISAIFVDWIEDSNLVKLAMQQSIRQIIPSEKVDHVLHEIWGGPALPLAVKR
jgi:hypothetical protein